MRTNSCPKCQGSMSEGYVLDVNQGGAKSVSTWIEGAPEKSFWGLKTGGGKLKLEIQTWRCGRCGFLENYAKG